MIISIIIISCLLLFNWFLLRILKNLYKSLKRIESEETEMAFFKWDIDIPEEEIIRKFQNATLFCRMEKNKIKDETWQIFDISNYSKNHIIGLTYFVQEQIFEELKKELYSPEFFENIKREIMKRQKFNPEEEDEEFLNALLDSAIKEVLEEEEYDEISIIPHCTVYQLKNGRWLWRPEKGD